MRIGDLVTIERTPRKNAVVAAEKRKRAPTGERGTSGLYTLGDVLTIGEAIDYLAAMRPPDRFTNVDKMLSDPSVWATFMAWVLPILSTARDVQPGGTAPEDAAIADFIREDLLHTSTTLQQIRYEELLSVAYGVTVHSKVWEYREDGRVHLRNLAYRPPSSIREDGWLVDEHGGPKAIVQQGQAGEDDVTLPIDEILMHIHLRVGGNITGRSGLRAAYKPWWYKDKVEGIAAVAVERGQGIPVGTQTGEDDKVSTYIARVLKGLRTHQLSYVKEVEGKFAFRMEGRKGEVVDPLPLLQYHSIEIFRSVLAQHVALSGTDVGSWALAKGDIDFLVMALEAVVRRIEDTLNQHLIPQWVRYNWAGVPRNAMPRVVHSPLNARNVKEWFEALVPAVAGNVVDPDDEVKRMAREMLGVPEPVVDRPEPQTQDDMDAEEPAEEGEQGPEQGPVQQWRGVELARGDRLESEVMLEALGIEVDFVAMAAGLDKAEAGMVKAAKRIQAKQIRNLVNRGREAVAKGDPALVSATDVRFVDELDEALAGELERLYELGTEQLEEELEQQDVKPQDAGRDRTDDDRGLLVEMAAVMAAELADRLMRTWAGEVLRLLRVGRGFDRAALGGLLDGLAESTIEKAARLRSAPALNMGRAAVAAANADAIEREIYSAVMDLRTCPVCRAEDGKEYGVGEGAPVPNPRCHGLDRCRCVRVPVARQA